MTATAGSAGAGASGGGGGLSTRRLLWQCDTVDRRRIPCAAGRSNPLAGHPLAPSARQLCGCAGEGWRDVPAGVVAVQIRGRNCLWHEDSWIARRFWLRLMRMRLRPCGRIRTAAELFRALLQDVLPHDLYGLQQAGLFLYGRRRCTIEGGYELRDAGPGGMVLRSTEDHVSRAKRREDSGKSIPVTNHATAPHPIAMRSELDGSERRRRQR